MSYAMSEALQRAVYEQLSGDSAVVALVGTEIYDAVPPASPAQTPDMHITLGGERVRDGSTKTSLGAVHDFAVTVHARTEGFRRAKAAAGAICDALIGASLTLTRGVLIDLRFLSARADRGAANQPRRVTLRFRAVLEDTI